jgi:hypothetical protein
MNGSIFFCLDTSRRWVVSFTPLMLYPPGKRTPVPIGQEAGSAQKSVSMLQRNENSWPHRGLEIWTLSHPARSQSLYRLRYRGSSRHDIRSIYVFHVPGRHWILVVTTTPYPSLKFLINYTKVIQSLIFFKTNLSVRKLWARSHLQRLEGGGRHDEVQWFHLNKLLLTN